MLFDYSYLTERALEELVLRGVEKREYMIDEDDKERGVKYLFIGIILFAIFCLSVIFLVKPEDGDKAFFCIVFGMVAFTTIPLYLSKKVSKAKKKLFSLEKIITAYIAKKYHNIDDDSLFLSKLYKMNKLEPSLCKKINSFLSKENKDFQDYLDMLNDKELSLLATPYKARLISEIGSIVQAYLEEKQKEEQAVVQFHNKSKEFFYSTMPKNLAIQRDKLCC
jgi:hypothetical protein